MTNMTKTDNRWTLEEFEMQIADMMDAWKAGDDGKVVPLHRAVA